MTVLVPVDLDQPIAGPSTTPGRSFASPATPDDDEAPDLADVVRRVRGARRIVVISGAGVSTAVAIPDFRSASGLFSGAKGHAVKDLFHVKSLGSATLLPEHHALLTDLCERSFSAEPTAFHQLLAAIDADGRLLRCYTQNIDGLEERAGLRTGIPLQRKRPRKGTRTGDVTPANASATMSATASAAESMVTTPAPTESEAATPAGGEAGESTPMPTNPPEPSAPRCIPLHGLLRDLHCVLCSTSVPLADFLPLPPTPIPCPSCDEESNIRSALSERQRRVGTLRASVVLYGEEHPEGDLIGTVVERDLKGTGPRSEREGRADLLLVVGTSLAIPGVKRIVKEMSKALSARAPMTVRDGKAPPIRTVYLNAEPPAKPAEWDGVFDVWAQGDIQKFADLVTDDAFAPPLPKDAPRSTPKRKAPTMPPTPDATPTKKRGRKAADSGSDEGPTPTKKRKATLPLTPRPTPPKAEAEKEKKAKRPAKSPAKRPRPPSPSPAAREETKPKPKSKIRRRTPSPSPAAQESKPKRKTPKRARQPSPSPAAKEDKPASKATKRARPRTPSPSPSSDTKPQPVDNAYIDVPPLPGPRCEWILSPPMERKPSLADILSPHYSHTPLHSHSHTYPPPQRTAQTFLPPPPPPTGFYGGTFESFLGQRARFSPPPPVGI